MHAQVWDAWQRFIQPLVSKVGLLVRILLVGTPGYRSTILGHKQASLHTDCHFVWEQLDIRTQTSVIKVVPTTRSDYDMLSDKDYASRARHTIHDLRVTAMSGNRILCRSETPD